MSITLYHNPACSKSRAALKLLEDSGKTIHVIDYVKTPPALDELERICGLLDRTPQQLIRTKEDRFQELGLSLDDKRSRHEWIQLLHDNPILIERPIAVHLNKAVIGRPPENAGKILTVIQARFSYSEALLHEGRKWDKKHRGFGRLYIALGLMLLCLGLFGIARWPEGKWLTIVMLLGGVFNLMLDRLSQGRFHRFLKRQKKDFGLEIALTFFEEGMDFKNEHRTGFCPWASMRYAVSTPDGFLVYFELNNMWIPLTAFSSEKDIKDLRRLLETHLKYRELKEEEDDRDEY